MERLSRDESTERNILPKLEMSELKDRQLLDDHSWGYVWGLGKDFVNFCTEAKRGDRLITEATFIDEPHIHTEGGKYTPEKPRFPEKVKPSWTTTLDLEFRITNDDYDGSIIYVFRIRNMIGFPLTHYLYRDGNGYGSIPLNPPRETKTLLRVSVARDTSEIEATIVESFPRSDYLNALSLLDEP